MAVAVYVNIVKKGGIVMFENNNRLLGYNRNLSSIRHRKADSSDEIPVPVVDDCWINEEPVSCYDEEPIFYPDCEEVIPDSSDNNDYEITLEEDIAEPQSEATTRSLPKRMPIIPSNKIVQKVDEPVVAINNTGGTFDSTHKRHTIYLTYPNFNKIVELKNEVRIKSSTSIINEALRIHLNNNF